MLRALEDSLNPLDRPRPLRTRLLGPIRLWPQDWRRQKSGLSGRTKNVGGVSLVTCKLCFGVVELLNRPEICTVRSRGQFSVVDSDCRSGVQIPGLSNRVGFEYRLHTVVCKDQCNG